MVLEKGGINANSSLQKTNNPSNRKHRNEAYLLERRNEHSGVEGEGCREDSLKACLMLPLLHVVFLHSEIRYHQMAEFQSLYTKSRKIHLQNQLFRMQMT